MLASPTRTPPQTEGLHLELGQIGPGHYEAGIQLDRFLQLADGGAQYVGGDLAGSELPAPEKVGVGVEARGGRRGAACRRAESVSATCSAVAHLSGDVGLHA